jgi:hypothetical protein
MSVVYHSSRPSTILHPRRRLRGCRTQHSGAAWTASVRSVRAALVAARAQAPVDRVRSGDELAEWAIDLAGLLDTRDRVLLAMVISILVRFSRARRGNGRQLDLPFTS